MKLPIRIPAGYERLESDCRRFLDDHPDPSRNVFIMTRYVPDDRLLGAIDRELRAVLKRHGLVPLRADDKTYPRDRNLWDNVCVYMICCGLGVAVLEDRVRDEFNPNVALEYGFMRALDKPVLLMVDKGFRNLRADVVGILQAQFDITDIVGTLRRPVGRWLQDLQIEEVTPTPLQAAADAWRRRLEKILSARHEEELNDEYWYLGEEIEKYRELFVGEAAPGSALAAARLAQQVIEDHDEEAAQRLLEMLGDLG